TSARGTTRGAERGTARDLRTRVCGVTLGAARGVGRRVSDSDSRPPGALWRAGRGDLRGCRPEGQVVDSAGGVRKSLLREEAFLDGGDDGVADGGRGGLVVVLAADADGVR